MDTGQVNFDGTQQKEIRKYVCSGPWWSSLSGKAEHTGQHTQDYGALKSQAQEHEHRQDVQKARFLVPPNRKPQQC